MSHQERVTDDWAVARDLSKLFIYNILLVSDEPSALAPTRWRASAGAPLLANVPRTYRGPSSITHIDLHFLWFLVR